MEGGRGLLSARPPPGRCAAPSLFTAAAACTGASCSVHLNLRAYPSASLRDASWAAEGGGGHGRRGLGGACMIGWVFDTFHGRVENNPRRARAARGGVQLLFTVLILLSFKNNIDIRACTLISCAHTTQWARGARRMDQWPARTFLCGSTKVLTSKCAQSTHVGELHPLRIHPNASLEGSEPRIDL